jgi:hypothetical protein
MAVAVDAVVEPDVLRDDIGGGVGVGLSGRDGGGGVGGDGERVGKAGGGSISDIGISESSPPLPSINGDSAEGEDDGSIKMLLRRGEPA